VTWFEGCVLLKSERGKGTRENKKCLGTEVAYKTRNGVMFKGLAESFMRSPYAKKYTGKVQLVFTSPPFPLNRKKKYGNLTGREYVKWLAEFAPLFRQVLKRNGSIVIEMGNAWVSKEPVMSTLALEALLAFRKKGKLRLVQQFIAYNKATLPGPAQWVNVERIRVKDAYTNIWWMALTTRPKADNRRVLKEYSRAMKELLETGEYNSGRRPSEHRVGKKSFLTDNAGAIPSNVLVISNTTPRDEYMTYCAANELPFHPARMHRDIPEFFIKFLTKPGDIVLDPFAGSNVTGAIAENLGRKWVSIEPNDEYVAGSVGRFDKVVVAAKRNVGNGTRGGTRG
jgi:site-specific DNA-methyltransferase (cytosine-N4-specific)